MANNANLIPKDNNGRRQIMPSLVQENRVLDPKKSQNIAILLRALNVTIDEVCEALLEGNQNPTSFCIFSTGYVLLLIVLDIGLCTRGQQVMRIH